MDDTRRIARLRMRGLGLWDSKQQSPESVVAHLTAMQSQEHAFARWSVAQRVEGTALASDVDRAFDAGDILRTHVLRPTWHYVARRDLRWLMTLSGPRVLARTVRRRQDLELDARTLTRATDMIADALGHGFHTRADLRQVLERSDVSVDGQRLAHILMHAELTGTICSGPMRGRLHTYARFDDRVPEGCAITDEEAISELSRRFFTTRGPATLKDFVWWSGLSAPDARRGIEMASEHLSSHSSDGRTYWLAEGTAPRARRRVDLVQCYDEVIISYSESRDVLQTQQAGFPVPGHLDGFSHVVLVNGQLAGHWRRVSATGGANVETRMSAQLDRVEQQAVTTQVERCLQFFEH